MMPRQTNMFLIINLGCEMLYVIDQRLKAQCITVENSAQVLRDLTCVLLDPKLLDQFMLGPSNGSTEQQQRTNHHLLTPKQCRVLLSDIACCSLMRLDQNSMDKLWDLMVMVFKWQLTLSAPEPQHLLDLTFRHMDGIGRLLPESRKSTLIDCTKRHLIEYWDQMVDTERSDCLTALLHWVRPFCVNISILIRLGFQRPDGTFETNIDSEFFRYYADHLGENIYTKHAYVTSVSRRKRAGKNRLKLSGQVDGMSNAARKTHEIESLVSQLNLTGSDSAGAKSEGESPKKSSGNTRKSSLKPSPKRLDKKQNPTEDREESGGSGAESSSTTDDSSSAKALDVDNGILEEVRIGLDAMNRQRRENRRRAGETIITVGMRDSEFEHIQRTCSSLDAIIERFSLDFFRPAGDVGIIEELDCTRELLRLLDENY